MQELISVIVPVYNVEKYLSRCIESIINQTYTNIEIILVDDGSTDNSRIICDEYKKKDKRINVIHKKNGGLSDARNKGIEMSRGEYLCFIDSDDYIEESFVEELYEMCIKNNVKISQCSFEIVKEHNKNTKTEIEEKEETKYKNISCQEMIYNSYSKYPAHNVIVCNKMFKKELFNDIKFTVGRLHEDEFTTYKLIYLAERIFVTNKKLYNYYQREGSITNSTFNLKKLDYLVALEERLNFFKEKKEERLYNKTQEQFCYYAIVSYYRCKKNLKEDSEVKEIEKELIKKYRIRVKELLKNKETRLLKKCVFGLGYIFPKNVAKILSNRDYRNVRRGKNGE